MYWLFALLGLCALFIALGCFYRVAATLFFLGFTYVFLLEQTRYLNHFYLICWMSACLPFLPLHRAYSVDNYLKKQPSQNVLSGHRLIILFVIAMPYWWGGVAKLNSDWLTGMPMSEWLTRAPFYEQLMHISDTLNWGVLFAYGSLILDVLAVPTLCYRPTRLPAYGLLVLFHLLNAWWFSIGIFPWLMILATTLFFSPTWAKAIFRLLSKQDHAVAKLPAKTTRKYLVLVFGTGVLLHTYLPLRHWLYPGNVSWTEEGHRFAWHMKLRDKRAKGHLLVIDQSSGRTWIIDPKNYLEAWQARKMMTRPYLIWQFAQHLANKYRNWGFNPAVYSRIKVSLNHRDYQMLVDFKTDLSKAERPVFKSSDWIAPLSITQ